MPFCPEKRETLAHFAFVCPRFREGRTAAHNQVRKLILSLLAKCLHNRWELHEETPMVNTGLRLNSASVSCMEASGHPSQKITMALLALSVPIACNLTYCSCLSHFGR